jgi:DNA-binding MarR family transcriptional regulator
MRAATLSSGAVTNRIDRLEEAGWVVRVNDVNDRRVTYIHLTPVGRKLVDAALPTRLEQARRVVALLNSGEAEQVARGLRKLLLQLESDPAEAAPAFQPQRITRRQARAERRAKARESAT